MSILQDVREAWRRLSRSPYFTIPVLLSLIFALGANVAAFSVVNTLLLRTVPVPEPERLFSVQAAGDRGVREGANYTWYELVKTSSRTVSPAIQMNQLAKVTSDGQVQTLHAHLVSGDYFQTLGVKPLLGRLIEPADQTGGPPNPVAVLSEAYWTSRFGRDPGVLGRTLISDRRSYTIVGVTPASYAGLETGRRVDVTVPIDANEYRRGWASFLFVVRLAPGVTPAAATAELSTLVQDYAVRANVSAGARAQQFRRVELTSVAHGVGDLRKKYIEPALAVMVLVGVMLLLACANWATLSMARASARRREMAIRAALGSSRGRITRHVIVESLMLALTGGALGFLVATWSVRALGSYLPENGLPIGLEITPDRRVALFTLLISTITGMMFGVAPAWLMRRVEARELRASTGRVDVRSVRLGTALVVAQVALSLVLVVAATFFVATLRNLRSQDMGFAQDGVMMFTLDANGTDLEGESLIATHRQVLDRLRTLPAAGRVTLASIPPLSGKEDGKRIVVPNFVPGSPDDLIAQVNTVGPDYFETFGIPVIKGRGILGADTEGAPKIAVVSESAAKFYFPGVDPIGQRFETRGSTNASVEIVGVVPDVMYRNLRTAPARMIYVPFFQRYAEGAYTFAIRTNGRTDALVPAIHRNVTAIAPVLPVLELKALSQQIDQRLINERLLATLSGFFGALALLLAGLGIYGIVAYAVSRRTSEIALRIALGARRGQVLWLVMRGAMIVVVTGIALGLAGAALGRNLVTSMLFGLPATDMRVYATAAAFLTVIGLIAAVAPVLRALRIQPTAALRYD
jgi:predicted permease